MSAQPSKQFEKIYRLVRKIPRGKVTTYGTIGNKLNMSPRVVGHALHLNPNPKLTPCHRVVNRDGRIASVYAFGGNAEQRRRLEKESIRFNDSQHLDLKKYFYEL